MNEENKNEEFKKAWAIVKAVYGIPGSGLAFQNTVENDDTVQSNPSNMVQKRYVYS